MNGFVGRRPAGAPAVAALCLSVATWPIHHVHGAPTPFAAWAPSERDLAYERGVQAEEAGDAAAAAIHYERAYRLTPAAESGPRLLFLRASVAARLRADDGRDPRAHLCPARALLREHLAGSAEADAGDPLAAERASLARVEQRLTAAGAIDCDAPTAPTSAPPETPGPSPSAPPATSAEPPPSAPANTPGAPSAAPAPATPSLAPDRPRVTRALRIAGAASLGVGAAALAVMSAGIVLADRATDRGRTACWKGQVTCEAFKGEITDIVAAGERADRMIRVGAVLGGLGVLTGVVLLAVSKRAGRGRLAWAPALAPGAAGVALSGRF